MWNLERKSLEISWANFINLSAYFRLNVWICVWFEVNRCLYWYFSDFPLVEIIRPNYRCRIFIQPPPLCWFHNIFKHKQKWQPMPPPNKSGKRVKEWEKSLWKYICGDVSCLVHSKKRKKKWFDVYKRNREQNRIRLSIDSCYHDRKSIVSFS